MKRAITLLLIFLATIISPFAQSSSIPFNRYTVEAGLSQSFIHCLEKDKQGYIWIGTQDGLSRFDGYDFDAFYASKKKEHNLSNNYIWDILEDNQGDIWIGTNGGGLNFYDTEKEQFQTFYPTDSIPNIRHHSIRQILQTTDGNILTGTEAGLFIFNTQKQSFQRIKLPNRSFSNTIFSLLRVSQNEILIGSLESIFLFNEKSKALKNLNLPYTIGGGIHEICLGHGGTYWAGTGNGLIHFKTNHQKDSLIFIQHYRADSSHPDSLSSNYISCLLIDQDSTLWIGTNNGLQAMKLHSINPTFSHYVNGKEDNHSISSNLIFDLLEIESGYIWAATQEGINQFNSKPSIFNNIDLSQRKEYSCGSAIHGLETGSGQNFLACTNDGLINISPNSKHTEKTTTYCYNKTNNSNLSHDFLVNIVKGKGDHYWLAYRRGGYAKVEEKENQLEWTNHLLPAGDYRNIGTNDFLETEDSVLWIASSGLGLWKLDQKKNTFQSFTKKEGDTTSLSGNYIFALTEDNSGFLWVATADGGLCKMDRVTNTFQRYTHSKTNGESISSNMVLSVFEDSKNRLWICTAMGLNLLTDENTFQRFYQKDGLPNDVIYGMLEDEDGFLWASTNNGLSKIWLDGDQLQTQNFTITDGLLANEFNQHSYYKTNQGLLCFGTAKGISCFNPKDVASYSVTPTLLFTNLKLFNENVEVGINKKGAPFKIAQSINTLTEVTLPYNQNFVAFEFAGICAEQNLENQYAYQMVGLDENWVYCGKRRFANYPNLKAGQYTFQIKAANHDGVWSPTPKKITLTIKNPPWKTWWAGLGYILTIGSLIYGFIQYRIYNVKKIAQAKQTERALFRQRSARDFHDEAGNQITKISLMAAVAKRQAENDPKQQKLLSQMESSVQELRTGMRDFIWVLDPGKDTLLELFYRIKNFGNELFEYSSTHFTSSGIDEQLRHIKLNNTQRRHLLLICKEIMNNSLKYAQASSIHFSVTKTEEGFQLKLQDDGIGFKREEVTRGNGLKNIVARSLKIGANYQFIAEPNKGTTLILNILTTQMGD